MFYKKLQTLTYTDIQELIDNKVYEHRQLDYKEDYSVSVDKETGEFLADISSFANDVGGYLLYGVKAEDGVPLAIKGIDMENFDKEKLKMEGKIQQSITPRLKVEFHIISIPNSSKVILVIHIPRSWQSPHRVTFCGYGKTKDQFYSRNSSGKYQLDLMELKQAFLRADSLASKIDTFLTNRINAISREDNTMPLMKGAKMVLHLIPVESFSVTNSIDLATVLTDIRNIFPIYSNGCVHRINVDGIIAYSSSGKDESVASSYLQLYRSGMIEAVEAGLLSDVGIDFRNMGKLIPSITYECAIKESLISYTNFLKKIGMNVPIAISFTLIGVKGFTLSDSNDFSNNSVFSVIDRNIIQAPIQLLENFSDDYDSVLKVMFDIVWNACGQLQSKHFDANKRWKKRI